jgi:hypothetical protein
LRSRQFDRNRRAADVRGQGHLPAAASGRPLQRHRDLHAGLRPDLSATRELFAFADVYGRANDAASVELKHSLASFPDTTVRTKTAWVKSQAADIDTTLDVFYVPLALAVIISLFGMINTLILPVFERTREIGMLRSVGLTRRQTRTMIRQESIITALIGAALGLRSASASPPSSPAPTQAKDSGSTSRSTRSLSSQPSLSSPAPSPQSCPPAAHRGSACSRRSSTNRHQASGGLFEGSGWAVDVRWTSGARLTMLRVS